MITDYVGYWPLDEASGNVADRSVNGYTGTNNGTTSVEGKIYNGREFVSASSQYISMGNVLDFTTNDFTISFWFKSTSGTNGYLLVKGIAADGSYIVYFNGSGRLALFVQTNSSNWKQVTWGSAAPAYDKADGSWHHFVGTRSGASNPTLSLFIDGSISGVLDSVQGSGTVTTLTNTGDLTLSSPASFYNGSLDEVRIYNRALSAEEANQLYTFSYNKKINSGIRPRPFAPGHSR